MNFILSWAIEKCRLSVEKEGMIKINYCHFIASGFPAILTSGFLDKLNFIKNQKPALCAAELYTFCSVPKFIYQSEKLQVGRFQKKEYIGFFKSLKTKHHYDKC